MAEYVTPEEVKSVFRKFWDKSYEEIYTSMSGMADLWEGPVEGADGAFGGRATGSNAIYGIRTYGDRVYVVQGGMETLVKVFTPNGIEIYDLGTRLCLMVHNNRDIYGSFTVINEHELIIGYMYVNLLMQYAAPYGHDLSTLWRNPAAKYSIARISSTSWVSAVRDNIGWHLYLNEKASPEDCLPCSAKEETVLNGEKKFSCSEEKYSYEAMQIDAFRASRSMLATGANASVSYMNGFEKLERIPMPQADPLECINNMDEYVTLFNKVRTSPTDIGQVGQKMSKNCSSAMYGNMIQTMQYKRDSSKIHDDYIESYITGSEDNADLLSKLQALVALIIPLLSEISESLGDNESTRSLFTDQIWWGPIWLIANSDKFIDTENDDRINAYSLVRTVGFEDFMDTLKSASSTLPSPKTFEALPMAWIIMSDADTKPVKYSKTSMTYFRFPYSTCTSTRKLFSLGNNDIKAICDIETRTDGIIVWAWDDTSTLNNRMYTVLRCFKMSNEGVVNEIGSVNIGYEMSPVDSSAKAVGISPNEDYWIVRDYYLKDSTSGDIGFVETKVGISDDMTRIMGVSTVLPYSNLNEISGEGPGRYSTTHYSDGLLEKSYEPYDLDDGFMDIPAWGNDGKQYSYVAGYSGYQIHSPDLL